MSLDGPEFHAWCADEDRVDAFAATLEALLTPKRWSGAPTVEDRVSVARAELAANMHIRDGCSMKLASGDMVNFDIECCLEGYKRGFTAGPLVLQPDERRDFLVEEMTIALGGIRSVEIEAAVLTLVTLENVEDVMLRLCAPDHCRRVKTGACTWFSDWGAPLRACATYHADITSVARDVAMSWIHSYAPEKTENLAPLSLDALQARVENARHGARINVAGEIAFSREHHGEMCDFLAAYPVRVASSRGQKLDFVGKAELSREEVLKTIATPWTTLLEALEAAAIPDKEWQALEPMARETIEAKKQGAPCYEECVTSRKHLQFIQHHAPYHVRRLENGGVLLATHPYRTLWPLWSDALALLGIRE